MDERGSAPPGWWITVNEPNIFAFATHAMGAMPSGLRPSPARFRRGLDQLLTAHVLAYRAVHRASAEAGWPRPSVTYNTYCMTAYSLDRALMDLGQARAHGVRMQHARPFLRRELARRMTSKNTPDLDFRLDTSMERAQELTEIMRRNAAERV